MSNSGNNHWEEIVKVTYDVVDNNQGTMNETTLARVLRVNGVYANWLSTNGRSSLYEKVDAILDLWKNQKNKAEENAWDLIRYLKEHDTAQSCTAVTNKLEKRFNGNQDRNIRLSSVNESCLERSTSTSVSTPEHSNDRVNMFDGAWYDQTEDRLQGIISGNILTWTNGVEDSLEYYNNGNNLTMIDQYGENWTAILTSSHLLQWNNGAVWTKEIPKNKDEIKNTCCWGFCTTSVPVVAGATSKLSIGGIAVASVSSTVAGAVAASIIVTGIVVISIGFTIGLKDDLCLDVLCPNVSAPTCQPLTGQCGCGDFSPCPSEYPSCALDDNDVLSCQLCEFMDGRLVKQNGAEPGYVGKTDTKEECANKTRYTWNDAVGISYGFGDPLHNTSHACHTYSGCGVECAIEKTEIGSKACFFNDRNERLEDEPCGLGRNGTVDYFCGLCTLGLECTDQSNPEESFFGCGRCKNRTNFYANTNGHTKHYLQ